MIKGNNNNDTSNQLKNWKLEGQKESDGQWIVLDSHNNDPLKRLQIRPFDVSCEERLKSIKITQTGTNTSNGNSLDINSFDIFGILFE